LHESVYITYTLLLDLEIIGRALEHRWLCCNTLLAMGDYLDTDHLDKLKKLKAEYEADLASVESDHDALKANLRKLEQKQNELRRLIEGVDGVLSGVSATNRHPQSRRVVPRPTAYGDGTTSSQESITTTNELSEKLSRRELILRMLPEFHGETFTAREVREKFVEKYLEAEPPTSRKPSMGYCTAWLSAARSSR